MSFYCQVFPAGSRAVLNETLRIQIHDINIVIVCRKRSCNLRVGLLPIQLCDRQYRNRDGNVPGDRVAADPARKAMHLESVRCLLIIEQTRAGLCADLHQIMQMDRVIFPELFPLL